MTDRVLLTLGTLAFAVLVYALMLKGWRSRQRRQADLPAPAVPDAGAAVVVGPVPGLFVGTTTAESWLDRIAVHHLSDRARGSLALASDGVHLLRDALDPVLLPTADLRAASIETSLAGKVVSTGMLVVTWQLGDRTLASAFRADDPADHPRLLAALTAQLPVEA